MFEIELQVELHHQQFMDDAERFRLIRTDNTTPSRLYAHIKNVLHNIVGLWNTHFQKDMLQVVEACCAVVAPSDAECVQCGAAA
jgi:hypothetical protein